MNDLQRKREIVRRLRPIDDTFFEVLMRDIEVCQELLQIILEDSELRVQKLVPQNSVRNLQGRSVRLDAYCIMGDGTSCNIEVQKSDDDDHLKRVRYNASCITANITEPGIRFKEVPTVYVIYISRFDMFRKGRTIYHVEKVLRENGEVLDDGLYEIYVNTCIDDGSTIAEYMQCFLQENVHNQKFPHLTRTVAQYKVDEKGADSMCDLVEQYAEERVREATQKATQKASKEAEAQLIGNFLKSGMSAEQIAQASGKPLAYVKEIEKNCIHKK